MRKISILFLILVPVIALAQSAPDLQNQSYVSKGSLPFFDPSKLSMKHSYSLSYYSGNGRSGSIGYFMNSIEYAVANPLKIRFDIGYLHSPTSMISKNSSITDNGVIVPGVAIDWRPTDNMRFHIDIRQVPATNTLNDYRRNYYQWEDYR
jgi:acetyltransferase-like isoleucine patch superfamily enzyme